MACFDLSGEWICRIPGQELPLALPGTLDESGVGFPDDPECQWKVDEVRRIGFYRDGDPIVTRLTRKHVFEGCAAFSRTVEWPLPAGKRLFVECERARKLRLLVNGREAPLCRPANLASPYVFEITGLATGRDEFAFLSDNSYPSWPRDAIVYSSAASDETQTNWNGLLGFVRIRAEDGNFISGVRVYPDGDSVDVSVELDLAVDWRGGVRLQSEAFPEGALSVREEIGQKAGKRELWYPGLPLKKDVRRWDIEEGNLYDLTVSLSGMESRTVSFGVRDFAARNGHFELNGRLLFLRGEANCAVFPLTGYPPMEKDAWKTILQKYRDYGVNCMRFHSHCPPEAAFAAADEMGMLMQPELSHWDPAHAFETPEARAYYETEFREILRMLANHPSFVMLTFGNELHANEEGRAFMTSLLQKGRGWDGTRLYANASNPFYGSRGPDPASDFYTSANCGSLMLRATSAGPSGWLNREKPDFTRNYDPGVGEIRRMADLPVFSFEAGQYEVLPDFDEIAGYTGVLSPENLRHIQKKVREKGLEKHWKRCVEATGESALLCYRAEIEAALRTEGLAGISLLGLQDFPGQGTAPVGMMNALLNPKPFDFARPERFRAFFRDQLPLLLLPRFTFSAGETLDAEIKIANYGKNALCGGVAWTLSGPGFSRAGALDTIAAPAGGLTSAGRLRERLDGIDAPARLTLTLRFAGVSNEYPLWVYPEETAVCPQNVYECRSLNEKALRTLRAGGRVYLSPDSTEAALPHSIPAQFSPDFWSVCTFPSQAGGMGQLIDASHPIFRRFPTEPFNNWQWRYLASQRAMILPEKIDAIITEMDSYAFLRPMAKLFECRCGGGRLLVSSLGLHQLQSHPEARALQRAIYAYLGSDAFEPRQALPVPWIQSLLQ
ncbi:MAG: hypothetical protein IKQ41_09440 [Clostridia bacterium]|nr:hypothetical protein [Clostridia bacterium]